MPRSKTKGKISQPRRRTFAETAEFPRWMMAAELVLVGFILWLAVFSDASGKVELHGPGAVIFSLIYMAIVLGVAVFLIYLGRSRRAGGRGRR